MTTYRLYGAGSADYFATSTGAPDPTGTATVWTAATGGTQITDLLNAAGSATTTVTADSLGGFRFSAPDTLTPPLWLDRGGSRRYACNPADVSTVAGSAQTTATTAATNATTALARTDAYYNAGNKSGAVVLDASQGLVQEYTLTGNQTSLTINNAPAAGGSMTLIVNQDATGGWAATFPASWYWESGVLVGVGTVPATDTVFELLFGASGKVRAVYGGKRFGQVSSNPAFKSLLLSYTPRYAYDFQDAAGSTTTTATDASGNSRVGTWNAAPTFGSPGLLPSDYLDTSVTMDGSTWLAADHSVIANPNAAWSLVTVAKITTGSSTSANHYLYSEGTNVDATTNPVFNLIQYSASPYTYLRVLWRNAGGTVLLDQTGTTAMFNGSVHFIALTYSVVSTTGTLKVYVDGTLVNTYTVTVSGTNTGAVTATWGASRRATASATLVGDVSYASAFTAELSSTQVSALQAAR